MASNRLGSIVTSVYRFGRWSNTALQSRCSFLTRSSYLSQHKNFSSAQLMTQKETVTIYFTVTGGKRKAAKAKLGDSLLDVVTENNLDIDGYGACEGTLACSTCHLIFRNEDFKRLKEKPTDEELDMLDLAYGLTDMSRLGCQIIVTKDMDGWEVTVPGAIADARS